MDGGQESAGSGVAAEDTGVELEQGRGGRGGSGTQKFMHQTWAHEIFPFVNVVFSHDGHFGGGGGAFQGWVPSSLQKK